MEDVRSSESTLREEVRKKNYRRKQSIRKKSFFTSRQSPGSYLLEECGTPAPGKTVLVLTVCWSAHTTHRLCPVSGWPKSLGAPGDAGQCTACLLPVGSAQLACFIGAHEMQEEHLWIW